MIVDVLQQPLYDTRVVRPGAATWFFQDPIGRGESCFEKGPKTISDTNLVIAGQLSAGYHHIVRSLYAEVVVPPASPTTLAAAVIEFMIGARNYTTLPFQRTTLTLVVESGTADKALAMARALEGVATPLATSLLSTVPGLMLGFNLESCHMEIAQTTNFALCLTPGAWLREAPIVRLYLNGINKRLPQ